MIHIAIGTKAQFIKMAPIMQELQRRSINFNLIDLGQHSLITKNLREEFGIKEPDIYLSKDGNISCLSKGIIWIIRLIFKGFNAAWVRKEVFLNQEGVCLIHGDTASTLLALYLAKRARIKVAHIEAGLRSHNYLEPFPEELLRVVTMRFSDILFAPSEWAFNNLKEMKIDSKALLMGGNTSYEATLYAINKGINLGLKFDKFVMVTVHRMENIFSRKKLTVIMDLIYKISKSIPVIFIQHPPTIYQLKKFKLQRLLEKEGNIHLFKILSHAHFIHLLNRCEFVITDGGSIQEEAFYLGKPCLLLRNRTERAEGLGENVLLCGFSFRRIEYFLNNYVKFVRKNRINENLNPSKEIIDYLLAL